MKELRLLSGGAWVPSIVVFYGGKSKSVNVGATATHVCNLAKHGAEGVVINGTTGEGHLISHKDKLRLIEAVGEAKRNGRIPESFILISGTGTENLSEAKEIMVAAKKQQFDGVLVLPPKQKDRVKDFYKALAAACGDDFGLLVYHHPRLDAAYAVTPKFLAELMQEYPAVIGVKDSSGDKALLLEWVPTVKEIADRDMLLAVGEDFFVADGLFTAGARAAIAGAANTHKGLSELKAIFKARRSADEQLARSAQSRFDQEINRLLKGVFRNNAKRDRIR